MKDYKVVCSIEFPDGHYEYVLWEPEFYGKMVQHNVDIYSLFYDTSRNGFSDQPLEVSIDLYDNPIVQTMRSIMGDNEVSIQMLVGTKVIPLKKI